VTTSPYARDPVTIDLKGVRIAVPYRCAAEWMAAVGSVTGPSAVLAQLVRETTQGYILDELALGEITDRELQDASYELIRQTVPVFDWWATYRLLVLASSDRIVTGQAVLAGMDPWKLSPAEWCSALYVLLQKGADDKGRFKFDAALFDVPAGVDEESDWGEMSIEELAAAARGTPGIRQEG
jgi:hypothetical protein